MLGLCHVVVVCIHCGREAVLTPISVFYDYGGAFIGLVYDYV